MIRPFVLPDLGLLVQLRKNHVSLCPIEALTRPQSPLWSAMASLIPFGEGRSLTFVLQEQRAQDRQQRGCIQASQPPAQLTLYIQRLMPALNSGKDGQGLWTRLLNHVVSAAGERGLLRVLACAGDESPEMAALSTAGFKAYAREDIYRLAPKHRSQVPAPSGIRQEQSTDGWGIAQLYRATTPHLVQLAESPSEGVRTDWLCGPMGCGLGEGFVLEDEAGMAGYGSLVSGRIGHWLRILVLSRAFDRSHELIDYGLALLDYYPPHTVYCGVREYQGGVRVPLEERGFELVSTVCQMVRHTTVRVKEPVRSLVPTLEKRIEAPTTTLSPTERT